MIKHYNIKIYGRVQGVFFRVTAKEKAHNLDIKGFARNESDGTVYIEAEGEEKNLKKFLSWCKIGPDGAKVKKIKITEGPFKNFAQFERDFIDY